MCFSVESPTSFANIGAKWAPEVKKHCPNVPIILVGTKLDMRGDQKKINELAREGKKPITTQEGQNLAKQIGAAAYLECSAKANNNVKEVFHEAIKTHLSPKKPQNPDKKTCKLL
jgi:GTPase SAR1 family protein